MCQACPPGGPFFHFQQLAHLAAFEVISPPLHQFGAVFKVGPTVVSSPRAIALAEFVNDFETPGDFSLVRAAVAFC